MREPLWDKGQANHQRMEGTAGYLRLEQMSGAATSLKLPTTENNRIDLERIKGGIRRQREEWTQEREKAARSWKKDMEEEEQRRLEAFQLELCGKESGGDDHEGLNSEEEEGTQTTRLGQELQVASGVFFCPDPNRLELLSVGVRVTQPKIFIPFGEFTL